jgi:hypothetical protein
MNINLFLGILAAILLVSGVSHADYSFHLSGSNAVCEDILGDWSAKGKATNWLLGSCTYHGTGTVSPVDSDGHFTAQVTAYKDYGTSLCPKHFSEQINATCVDAVVTVKTDFGRLKGTFSGTSGSASGTLSVSSGINANVSIKFFR